MSTPGILLLYLSLASYPALALLCLGTSTLHSCQASRSGFQVTLGFYFMILSVINLMRFVGRIDWAIYIADWLATPVLLLLVINRAVKLWQQGRYADAKRGG